MFYQVLTRRHAGSAWHMCGPPTSDHCGAQRRFHEAKRFCAASILVQTATPRELALLIGLVQRGEATPDQHQNSPCSASTAYACSAPQAQPASLDEQRRHLEQGSGGDHDEPYRFELPEGLDIWYQWIRLLAQARRANHVCAE